MKLEGKVAVVTGTSPNIGGGIAIGMAEEGAAVVCADVLAQNARGCAEHIRSRGGQAMEAICDITSESEVAAMIGETTERFGGVDILVNNAVIFNQKGVLDMPLDEWRRQIDVMLTGAFLCTKHAARAMIERGARGSVINIISTAGHQGQPENVGYCTGKSGLLNFSSLRGDGTRAARHKGQQPDAHRDRPDRGERQGERMGLGAGRSPLSRAGRAFHAGRSDGQAAQPVRLRAGGGLPRFGRRRDDNRHGPESGRGRGIPILGMDAVGESAWTYPLSP